MGIGGLMIDAGCAAAGLDDTSWGREGAAGLCDSRLDHGAAGSLSAAVVGRAARTLDVETELAAAAG